MILLQGTTLARAERILRYGPDPHFQEPSGLPCDHGFSMSLEFGPFHFGHPEGYARGKAREFPAERGAAILRVDVPEEIIEAAAQQWFPLSQGIVQFDFGFGLEELLAAWPA